jgi:hypothetical protein
LFIEKVEKGVQDADQGRTMTLLDAKNKLEEKWQTLQ